LSYAETKQSVRSKHLGSAAYLTYHGGVIQTLNYLPYGEDWVEHNFFHPDDTTRLGIYRFNGKEKDYESGFHYYGARYYWDETLTGWLSVDPLTDDFPYISCYNYCEQNPVKLKDLDGEGPVLGAVVGFIVEYGCQVAENWASGKHGVDMFVPNDGVMLAAATLEGAVTCGVSAGKTVARKAAFTAARSVYVGAKEGSIAAGVNNAIVETVGNVVGGGVPKAKPKVVKAVKKNNSQAYKEAKATGPMYNARAKQVKAANEAQNKRSVAAAQSQNKKNINTANNKNAARSTAATGVVQGTARSAQKAAQKKSNQ
jgi:RHS repeat-associated protein